MSWPKRLKKQLSRFSMPWRASVSPRPSAVSSRMACGSSVMPTPNSFTSGAASYTRQVRPRWCRASASVSPPMPPPMIAMSMSRPSGAQCSPRRTAAATAGWAGSARLRQPLAEHDRRRLVLVVAPQPLHPTVGLVTPLGHEVQQVVGAVQHVEPAGGGRVGVVDRAVVVAIEDADAGRLRRGERSGGVVVVGLVLLELLRREGHVVVAVEVVVEGGEPRDLPAH